MATYKPKAVRVAVGVTSVQVQTSTASRLKLGGVIQAAAANAGDIYVGDSTVDISGANMGIVLDAGESLSLSDFGTSKGVHEWDLNEIYLISEQASQFAVVLYPELVKA